MSENKVALVTGGNRGLGLEICRQLAARDFNVILTSRDERLGAVAVQQLAADGLEVLYCPMNVAKSFTVDRAIEFALGSLGGLDVVVNNAGANLESSPAVGSVQALSCTDAALLDSFQVNALGTYRVCRSAMPVMLGRGYGRIVNVTSRMGQLASMNSSDPAYSISKTAANAVTRIFADLVGEADIKVNSAHPGWVRTDMGGPDADLGIEEAAQSMLWLASLPADGPNGEFFFGGDRIAW